MTPVKKAALMGFVTVFLSNPAMADMPSGKFTPGEVKSLASSCIGKWDSQPCMSAVSGSNYALASMYGAALQQGGRNTEAEAVKQHCAASTAAAQGEYPAVAVRSAFTECANAMSDITEATQIKPEPSRYQILVSAVLCMTGDPRCAGVETGLTPYAK